MRRIERIKQKHREKGRDIQSNTQTETVSDSDTEADGDRGRGPETERKSGCSGPGINRQVNQAIN